METSSLTLVIPVYGESPYLGQALDSTLPFLVSNTRLLIIDDGLSVNALNFLNDWLQVNRSELITYVLNLSNLGLFKSLNTNLSLVETEWFCFLCSDDYLLFNAMHKLKGLSIPQDVGVILSRFLSVNDDRSLRYDDAQDLFRVISKYGLILSPDQMMLSLLRYGSLNGNLSGMLIRKSLWDRTGGFQDDWHHAADWDWLVDACNDCKTQINTQCLVAVRTHENQLSNKNQKNGFAESEALAVIKKLRDKRINKQHWFSVWWAGSLLQHHLWNLLFKKSNYKGLLGIVNRLKLLNQVTPLIVIFLAMLISFPKRLIRRAGMLLAFTSYRCP